MWNGPKLFFGDTPISHTRAIDVCVLSLPPAGIMSDPVAGPLIEAHLSMLGFDPSDKIPSQSECKAAYKRQLRSHPGLVQPLRVALSVLSSSDPSSAAVAASQPGAGAPSGSVAGSNQILALERKLVHRIDAGHRAPPSGPSNGRLACGFASSRGMRPTMEDELIVGTSTSPSYEIFGVVDGHGGARASRMLAKQFPAALAKLAVSDSGSDGILDRDDLSRVCADLDERVLQRSAAERWDDGACACVALVSPSTLQLIQVGDCNALLLVGTVDAAANASPPPLRVCAPEGRAAAEGGASGASGDTPSALWQCTSHRPTEATEAERLRAAGAQVSAAGRIGGIAVSRAFGDRMYKEERPGALVCTPEVRSTSLASIGGGGGGGGARLLVVACDGLWDFVSAQSACEVVDAALRDAGHAGAGCGSAGTIEPAALEAAARSLVEYALDHGGNDNVSVVVVHV